MKKNKDSSLTTCLDCKKKISKKVTTCPHCGSTEPTKTDSFNVLFFIFAFILIYLIFYIAGG